VIGCGIVPVGQSPQRPNSWSCNRSCLGAVPTGTFFSDWNWMGCCSKNV
jgi:hypothetical protein